MKTQKAIELAGNSTMLAALLGITPGAISQWGENIPDKRLWQLRVIKPEWFTTEQHLGDVKGAVERVAA